MALPHPSHKQIHSARRFCSFARFSTVSEVSPIRYTDASVYVTGTLCAHWLLHLDGAGAGAVTTSLQSKPIPADLRARPHACALERAWEQWVLGEKPWGEVTSGHMHMWPGGKWQGNVGPHLLPNPGAQSVQKLELTECASAGPQGSPTSTVTNSPDPGEEHPI